MNQTIWGMLAIPATRDVVAIKRAYAARLKALNLDTQAAEFQELREARDIALAMAADDSIDDAELAAEVGIGGGNQPTHGPDFDQPHDDTGDSTVDATRRPPDPDPDTDPDQQALQQHHQALIDILFQVQDDGTFYAASTDEQTALRDHFAAIAASPLTQDVATLANASQWFAGAITQMIPRSDALVEPAAALFGWSEADMIGGDAAIAAVMERSADLAFAAAVGTPGHPLHRAWTELCKPAREGSHRGWVRRKRINQLLTEIRAHHPSLERSLDWYRVSLWEDDDVPPTWLAIALRFVLPALAVLAINLCGRDADNRTTPAPFSALDATTDVMTNPADDIAAVVARIGGEQLTAADVKKNNPALYAMLKSNWDTSSTNHDLRSSYLANMSSLIEQRRRAIWSYAPAALLVERLTFERDVARSLGSTSGEACVAAMNGAEPSLFGAQRAAYARLLANQILAIDPVRPLPDSVPTTTSFTISSDVVSDARRRAALGTRFDGALERKGKPIDICTARLALYDAALALPPRKRTAMLRDMASD